MDLGRLLQTMRDLQFTGGGLNQATQGRLFSCGLKKQSIFYSRVLSPYVLTLQDKIRLTGSTVKCSGKPFLLSVSLRNSVYSTMFSQHVL